MARPLSEKEDTTYKGLALKNLVDYIYATRTRPDLQSAYPDISGQNRLAYTFWLINQAYFDYNLNEEFFEPIRARFLRWTTTRCA